MEENAREAFAERRVSGDGKALRVAIILPERPTLRTIRWAGELGAALLSAKPLDDRPLELAFGLAEPNEERWRRGEGQLRARLPGAIVRHVEWTRIPVANAERMFFDLPQTLKLEGISEVSIPRDWGWNFLDCDRWFIVSDPAQGAVLPLRPTIFCCNGLPERYIPQAVAASLDDPYWQRQVDCFRIWRQCQVLTSDIDTATDVGGYAGVRRSKIEHVPDILDALPPFGTSADANGGGVIWSLVGNALDDLPNALQGLAAYRREGGTLSIAVAAEDFASLGRHPSLRKLPPDLRHLFRSLDKVVYRSLREWERLLVRANVLWASQTAGGTSDHLHEARCAGIPLLAPSYPLNRRETQRLGLDAILYELGEPLAVCDSLHAAERHAKGGKEPAIPASPIEADRRSFAYGFVLDRLAAVHGC